MNHLFVLIASLLVASTPGVALAAITAVADASRGTSAAATDVAPLAVFFDAQATTSSGRTATSVYKHLHFRWDFGDPQAGTWVEGNQRGDARLKNVAFGPIAAHVFERPGAHTVLLTVTDPSTGERDQTTLTINVDDPNVVFSGTKTICYSTSASDSFSGCPSGARLKTGARWSTIVNDAAPNRRLLLKRGDNFGGGAGSFAGGSGPGHLGTFGSGARPTVTQSDIKIYLGGLNDWRFTGIRFTGDCEQNGVSANFNGAGQDFLLMDLKFTNCGMAIDTSIWGSGSGLNRQPRHAFVIDNVISCPDSRSVCVWFGGRSSAYMGNDVTAHGGTHGMRSPWWQDVVVNHNDVHMFTNGCMLSIKLAPENAAGLGSNNGTPSHSAIISDNDLDENECDAIAFGGDEGSNTAGTAELGIAERNYMVGGNWYCLRSAMRHGVARNNICIMDDAGDHFPGFQIDPSVQGSTPSGWISGFEAHNNTFVNRAGGGGIVAIEFAGGGQTPNSVARNNLLFLPNSARGTVVSGAAATSDNVLTRQSVFTGDPFAGDPGALMLQGADTTAQDQVQVRVVHSDFQGTVRVGPHDVGAFENASTSTDTDPPAPPTLLPQS